MTSPTFPGTPGLEFFQFMHAGVPESQGSKTLVFKDRYGRRLRKPRMIDVNQSKLRDWRKAVAASARRAGGEVFSGDLVMILEFHFDRPDSHWLGMGRLSKSKAAMARPRRKDVDKLARAVMDALTGVLYPDDRDVAMLAIERKWSDGALGDHLVVRLYPAPTYGEWKFE